MKDKEIEILKDIKRKIKRYPYRPTCALFHIFVFSNMKHIDSIKKFIETIDQHNIDRENSRVYVAPDIPMEYLENYEDIGIDKIVNIMAMLGCNSRGDLRALQGRILILKQEGIIEDDMLLMFFAYCSNTNKYESKINGLGVRNFFNSIRKTKVEVVNNAKLDSLVKAKKAADDMLTEVYHFNYVTLFKVINPVYIQLKLRDKEWIQL